jgi:putative ABC transport system ATP-binding protein
MRRRRKVSDTVLSLHGVSRDYYLGETRAVALDAVSVEFRCGEFAAVVGPSGSGKSTLLQLGAGFDRPSAGEIYFMDRDLAACADAELARIRNRDIGFIFQSFNLLPVLSALENVVYPALIYERNGEAKRAARERAEDLLTRVGLADQLRKRPHQLSGGQRQRVAVARALMNRPKVVFADEPTANLDHATGAGILDVLEELRAAEGTTLILATHDPAVMQRASRVVKLKDGRLEADGPPKAAGAER